MIWLLWEVHLQVLAHNAEEWKLSPRLASLFELPPGHGAEFNECIPDFAFRLIQLASLPFESIHGNPVGIMVLRAMKAERTASLLGDPVWDEQLLIQIPREVLELLIRYILEAGVDKNAFDCRSAETAAPCGAAHRVRFCQG
jgi:hypothetical protein